MRLRARRSGLAVRGARGSGWFWHIRTRSSTAERPAFNRRAAGSNPAGCSGREGGRHGTTYIAVSRAGLRELVTERSAASAAGGGGGAALFQADPGAPAAEPAAAGRTGTIIGQSQRAGSVAQSADVRLQKRGIAGAFFDNRKSTQRRRYSSAGQSARLSRGRSRVRVPLVAHQ